MMPIGPEAMAAAAPAVAGAAPVTGTATFLDGLLSALETSAAAPQPSTQPGATAEQAAAPVAAPATVAVGEAPTEPVADPVSAVAVPVPDLQSPAAPDSIDPTSVAPVVVAHPHSSHLRATASRIASAGSTESDVPDDVAADVPAVVAPAPHPKGGARMNLDVDVDDGVEHTLDQSTNHRGEVDAASSAPSFPPPVVGQLPPPQPNAAGPTPAANPAAALPAPVVLTAAPAAATVDKEQTEVAAEEATVASAVKGQRPGRRNQERAGRTAEMPVLKTSRFLGRNKGGLPASGDYMPHELRDVRATGPARRAVRTTDAAPVAIPFPPPPAPVEDERSSLAPVIETNPTVAHPSAGVPLSVPTAMAAPVALPQHAATSAPAAPAAAPARTALPTNLGMISVDRVRFAREQAPSRAVQRLAIDLDGAQVAVRVHHDRVAVEVVDDPTGTLSAAWAKQVEKSLEQAVRTVSEPQRGDALPQPQRSNSSTAHDTGGRDGGGREQQSSNTGEQGHTRRWQRAFSMLTEEDD